LYQNHEHHEKTLLALLVILSAHAVSQNLAPVGATWHYTMRYPFQPGESFFLIESVETVMLQGKECSKLVKNHTPGCFWQPKTEYVYEEDSVVYFWSDIIDDFQILFDFNAQTAYTGQYVPAKPEYLCQCKRA
jgi:hypothetical protein